MSIGFQGMKEFQAIRKLTSWPVKRAAACDWTNARKAIVNPFARSAIRGNSE